MRSLKRLAKFHTRASEIEFRLLNYLHNWNVDDIIQRDHTLTCAQFSSIQFSSKHVVCEFE